MGRLSNRRLAITREASKKGALQPYMIPIGERAQQIVEAFEQRQIDTRRALDELTALLKDARSAEDERERSGVSMEAFSVAWLLNREGIDGALDAGRVLETTFAQHPHWRSIGTQQAEVRTALYRELMRRNVDVERATSRVGRIIDILRQSEA